jgi:hypothetical protein
MFFLVFDLLSLSFLLSLSLSRSLSLALPASALKYWKVLPLLFPANCLETRALLAGTIRLAQREAQDL